MGAVPARPAMEERKSALTMATTLDEPKAKISRSFKISTVEDLGESEEETSKTDVENQSDDSLLTIDTNGRSRPQFIV